MAHDKHFLEFKITCIKVICAQLKHSNNKDSNNKQVCGMPSESPSPHPTTGPPWPWQRHNQSLCPARSGLCVPRKVHSSLCTPGASACAFLTLPCSLISGLSSLSVPRSFPAVPWAAECSAVCLCAGCDPTVGHLGGFQFFPLTDRAAGWTCLGHMCTCNWRGRALGMESLGPRKRAPRRHRRQ